MQESEQALDDAAQSSSTHDARIAKHILDDGKIHSLWESRNADIDVSQRNVSHFLTSVERDIGESL